MLLEVLIVLEILAFIFLALALIPFKVSDDNSTNPLINKIIFALISSILFFSLGMMSASYDYTYCYINETTTTQLSNVSIVSDMTATCAAYNISNEELSYLNYGGGVVAFLMFIIVVFMAITFTKERRNRDEL